MTEFGTANGWSERREPMDETMRPFSEHPACNMCLATGVDLKYSEHVAIRTPDGFIDAHRHESRIISHLIVTCRRCGYQWLMRTAEGR